MPTLIISTTSLGLVKSV
jgi:hypothetical protein